MRGVDYYDLGTISFKEAWDLQDSLFDDNLELKKRASKERRRESHIKDRLLLCEHKPVITLGKSGSMVNLLADESSLRRQGVDFFNIDRGGDITFHGPGQLVAYPILDLEHFSTDLSLYLWRLEEVVISILKEYKVEADRIKGKTGVWLDAENPLKARKICALGIRTSRWVTKHGLAFNINTDLNFFQLIVPCGISEYAVTSLEKELGHPVPMEDIKLKFNKHFEHLFEVKLEAKVPGSIHENVTLKQIAGSTTKH